MTVKRTKYSNDLTEQRKKEIFRNSNFFEEELIHVRSFILDRYMDARSCHCAKLISEFHQI